MEKKMKGLPKITISLSTPICLAAFCVIYGPGYISSIVLSVTVHELGHIAAIYLSHGKISEITIRPFGAVIKRAERGTSYFSDIFIALSGPLANIFSFILCMNFSFSEAFASASLILAIINLIPARPLDGYCAVKAFALLFFSPNTSEKICRAISLTVLSAIWVFTVYTVIFAKFNLSLLIMTTLLICEAVISRKEII